MNRQEETIKLWVGSSSGIPSSGCAPSTFSCVTDLCHKPVTLYTDNATISATSTSVNNNTLFSGDTGDGCNNILDKIGGRGYMGERKQCLWFSGDCGPPVFAMHSNCYLNSECFIIDTQISVLPIRPTYRLVHFKEYIHVIEQKETRFSVKFKDVSDCLAIWIHICAFQNVDPHVTSSVQLTKPHNMFSSQNGRVCSAFSPTTLTKWLTIKFKSPSSSEPSTAKWFTFAKMQLFSYNFKKGRYLLLLLKSGDDKDLYGLFCLRPGVTCLKTGSQFYYEPCDSTKRKYILEFDSETLCSHIWNAAKMVTPSTPEYMNYPHDVQVQVDKSVVSRPYVKGGKQRAKCRLTKRNRQLRLIYHCFQLLRQEVRQILLSINNTQEITNLPNIIIKLFFSTAVWMNRCRNLETGSKLLAHRGVDHLRNEIHAGVMMQGRNAQLHADILKMLMGEHFPAELISEYRDVLLRRENKRRQNTTRCYRIHCQFT